MQEGGGGGGVNCTQEQIEPEGATQHVRIEQDLLFFANSALDVF